MMRLVSAEPIPATSSWNLERPLTVDAARRFELRTGELHDSAGNVLRLLDLRILELFDPPQRPQPAFDELQREGTFEITWTDFEAIVRALCDRRLLTYAQADVERPTGPQSRL